MGWGGGVDGLMEDEERLGLGRWGGLGGCVVWVLLSVLLSRFKASSITYPGGGLT